MRDRDDADAPQRDPARRNGDQLNDLRAAAALLTRLPVQLDGARAAERGARAAWAYPAIGLVVGALGGAVFGALLLLGASGGVAAVAALAAQALFTGALHEDALADFADGIGGGSTPARRLEIMRDSRLGAFGATALIFGLIARWAALASFAAADAALDGAIMGFAALCLAGAWSRATMAFALYAMPHARADGLAATVGRAPREAALLALLIGLLVAMAAALALGWLTLFALFFSAIAALYVMRLAVARLGGGTGDVLGAVQQAAEIACLVVASLRG